jgi:hypothetical protein
LWFFGSKLIHKISPQPGRVTVDVAKKGLGREAGAG